MMAEQYEKDAVLLKELNVLRQQMESSPPEKQVVDYLTTIEDTMEGFDHIAMAFLLYDDVRLAQQKITTVLEDWKQNGKGWRRIVLRDFFESSKLGNNQRDMWKKVVEALYVLQQKKLLDLLGLDVHSVCHIHPLRRKLFDFLDALSEEEAASVIANVNATLPVKKSDPSWCIEMHILSWLEEGVISEQDLTKLYENGSPLLKSLAPYNESNARLPSPTSPSRVLPAAPSSCKFQITRGLCIIINQMKFYVDPSLPYEIRQQEAGEALFFRYGSEVDRDRLSETFRILGHDVEIYENLNRDRFLNTMAEIGRRDFRQYNGLVVCILSHGKRNCVYSTDSISIPLDVLKSPFDGHHCPTLIDKPKLFFLQACQGQLNQEGVRRIEEFARDSSTLPAVSNFFEAWATVPGFFSYRSTYRGAVFIQDLCTALQEFGHRESLLDLMTIVNKRVGEREIGNGNKQICSITFSLTKGVQFKRTEEDQFVKAIADQLERELLKDIIELAACKMWQMDPLATYKILANTAF